MNVESSSIQLRPAEFYQQYGIEVWTNKEVRSTFEVFVSDKVVCSGCGLRRRWCRWTLQTRWWRWVMALCSITTSCSSQQAAGKTPHLEPLWWLPPLTVIWVKLWMFSLLLTERGRSVVQARTWRASICCRVMTTPKRFTALAPRRKLLWLEHRL